MATWKDFDIEMKKQNDGDVKAMVDIDAIKNSISNIMQTIIGSRRMLPEFAMPIHGVVFEQLDIETANDIGNMLLQAIERWENRCIIENIHVTGIPDRHEFRVQLTFRLREVEGSYTITDVLSLR